MNNSLKRTEKQALLFHAPAMNNSSKVMDNSSKLTKKQESEICLACGECCKRYWITVLPEEANRISKLIKTTRKDFLENDCVLHVKLFPKTTLGILTFPSAFLPKRIFHLVKKELPEIPESFFVVPQIVLKREEKIVFDFKGNKTRKENRLACSFLEPENACTIYDSRPGPCRLFPFIAMPGLREQYPFCELFQKTFKDFSIESRIYYKKIQAYFKQVDEKGFAGFWRTPPRKGVIFLQEKQIGEISLEELEEMMPKK
jgi:Fe-S-cluster containining protein